MYETENRGDACLYRFVPEAPGALSNGGRLEAMRIGAPGYDTRGNGERQYGKGLLGPGGRGRPGRRHAALPGPGQRRRGVRPALGRWYGNVRVYVLTTNGGPAGQGQVFELDPATDEFQVLFVSPGADLLNAPDNMCVSPRGGLVLCEDGGETE